MSNNIALKWIEDNKSVISDTAKEIWDFAEISLQEFKSAELLIRILEKEDFKITKNVGGMPTAFMAEWGSGAPRIGFLAEYDALPGLSQKNIPVKEPLIKEGPGHGCQHNLLGAGCLGAVLGLQEEMKSTEKKGTIVFYGCPAEETLVGKVYMARDGVFDNLDAAIAWHPMSLNAIMAMRMLSVNSVKFTFHGVTAHAAADPHNGRSALDAVELMNVGANYLREHITTECRLHYSITNGGGEPNVVPATAQVWYYIRAPRRSDVEEVYGRLKKIAEGAALMTETSFDIEFLSGTHDLMPNDTLGNTMVEALKEVGAPNWDAEDYAYADKITASLQPGMKEGMVKQFGFPPEFAKMTLHDSIMPMLLKSDKVMPGSSDVGDVSYIVPTVFGGMTTSALGSPGHSWQNVAQAGSQIGFKGTIAAAKVMALTALKLIENPEILVKAKEEFQEMTGGKPYKSPLPEGAKAPVHQFEGH